MRFSQTKREEISLGVSIAPLIDIVFLLLIFFMLTSHFDIIS
jgi:biopolymer transport protein ExbD